MHKTIDNEDLLKLQGFIAVNYTGPIESIPRTYRPPVNKPSVQNKSIRSRKVMHATATRLTDYVDARLFSLNISGAYSNRDIADIWNSLGYSIQPAVTKKGPVAPTSSDAGKQTSSRNTVELESLLRKAGRSYPKPTDPMIIELRERLLNTIEKTFSEKICQYLQQKSLKPADVYKPIDMNRRLFSKIVNEKYYSPSKQTAILLALGLNLNLEETNDLLQTAGKALSHSIIRDVLIEFCIKEKIYKTWEIDSYMELFKLPSITYKIRDDWD
jgi:hypothetical protein